MAKSIPKELITPPPRYEFELRTIIYSTKDCIFKDEITQCNDIFVRGGPANAEQFLETDTHWRCRSQGSFNWRWKFKCYFPLTQKDYGGDRFKIQIWDKDLIGHSDLIGEAEIDLNTHKMIDKAVKRQKAVKMNRRIIENVQEVDKFWVDVYHPLFQDEAGNKISQGKVLIGFELIPIEIAQTLQNGYGRDAPNIYPTLDAPTGRLQFDILNPIGFLRDILGPNIINGFISTILSFICCLILIYLGFMVFTNYISIKLAS